MTNRTPLAKAIRLAIGGTAGLVAAMTAPLATAQDDQTIYVVGSRIGRTGDFESPSPVLTVDREAIENSGYQNLQQLIEKLPVNGNGAFSTRGNNQDSTANGAASISLRGLGADATLVLVNGRRVAISSFAESVTTNFVDINTIPVAAIERVEVLKDGASAVYGSDAVAGVINIVLRDDYEGFEVSAGYGDVTSGSSSETTASALWGTGGDDSNVTMVFDYFKNTTLENAERGRIGSADNSAFGGQDLRSSRGFPGRFFLPDGPDVGTAPDILMDPGCPAGSQAPPTTCVFDYGPFNLLNPASERVGLLLLGHKGMGAGVEVFTEVAVQHNTSLAQGAPTPLDESAGLTLTNHPDDPYAGTDAIGVSRFRTVDAGARRWHIETDNLRAVLGLRGEINEWNWEVAAQRGRSESTQKGGRSDGWIRTDFLQPLLTSGEYNPFGGTVNPQSVIDQITTSVVRQGRSNLTMFDAGISGKVFDMGAGPVMMAAGLEYRDENVNDQPDDQFVRGLIFGTEAVSASASRNNWSAFLEFAVPLHETVELSVAGRYDSYNDFGSTTNPKAAIRWSPIEQLSLRASWGQGFRAPSLAQIGLGPSQESEFFQDTYGCAVNPAYCVNTDFLIIFSGNPDLQPEESENWNVGAVWRPTDALNLSLDFWDIQQDNKIDEVPRIFIYTAECDDQASTICVRATPLAGDSLGALQFIRSGFVNIGSQSTQGIDFAGYYNLPVGDASLTLGLDWSHLLEFDKVLLQADNSATPADESLLFETQEYSGEYEYPEDRVALTGAYQFGDWAINSRVNFISSFKDFRNLSPNQDIDDPQDGVIDGIQPVRSVSSFTTVNFQFAYTGIAKTKIALSVDNAFDEKVPVALGDGDTDVYGYVSGVHNPRGRFWSLRTTYTF